MREFGAESRWFGEGWRGGCGVWRERMLGRGTHLGRTWVRVGKKKEMIEKSSKSKDVRLTF